MRSYRSARETDRRRSRRTRRAGIGDHAARFRGGAPGVLQGAFSYCCRTPTARSPLRIPFRPASTTPTSAPSTPGCTIRTAPNTWPRPTPKRSRRRPALADRGHHSRARIGARVAEASGARRGAKGQIFIVNVSGRGDKDIDIYRENFRNSTSQ